MTSPSAPLPVVPVCVNHVRRPANRVVLAVQNLPVRHDGYVDKSIPSMR